MKTALFTLVLAGCLQAQDSPFDLLIRNGRVVDGTGNPWFEADVGIRGGRIAALGRLEGKPSAREIDARGLVVAPGFFDIHNHSDYTVLEDGDAQSMVRQGVTSMILGEGSSAAPSGRFPDFQSYFGELRRRGVSTNIGTFLGSDRVWVNVRGERSGPASPEERERMRTVVQAAMREGVLGVAASLSGPPGNWIDTESLVTMCRAAAVDGGTFSIHLRTEGSGVFDALSEAIEIGRRAQIPVEILHLKIADHKLWGRMTELAARVGAARAEGLDITADVYPYRAGQNNLASIIPPWAHEGGRDAMIGRLRDPALRTRLEDEVLHGIPGSDWYNHFTATGGWEGMLLVSFSNPEYRRFEGKRMSEVIAALAKNPLDVLFELLEKNEGSVPTVYFHHSEEDMRYALRQPFVSVGSDGTAVKAKGPLSAGNPHPRYYGTFPRVLGRYVREENLLSLEEAVRKMTSANTSKLRIYDRGLLRPGMWADVTVFDPSTIIDRATFENPHQYATGVLYVIVNGTVVLDQGRHTGRRPGTILARTAH
jgi:N-acyl-D-amino-acid deacylase